MDSLTRTLRFYVTDGGKAPAQDWIDSIEGLPGWGLVMTRLEHVKRGLFGDYRSVGKGVSELRFKSGYRIYYGLDGKELVILLIGGTKATQKSDIKTAQRYWRDYCA